MRLQFSRVQFCCSELTNRKPSKEVLRSRHLALRTYTHEPKFFKRLYLFSCLNLPFCCLLLQSDLLITARPPSPTPVWYKK